MLEIHKIIHLIAEIPLNMQVIMKYATINEEKSFTVHPNTSLVFNIRMYVYVCNRVNNRMI